MGLTADVFLLRGRLVRVSSLFECDLEFGFCLVLVYGPGRVVGLVLVGGRVAAIVVRVAVDIVCRCRGGCSVAREPGVCVYRESVVCMPREDRSGRGKGGGLKD